MSTNIKYIRLFCALIIFLIIPLTINGFEFKLNNGMATQESANDSYNSYFTNELLPEINDTNSEVKPLPGKEYVEYYQADFIQDIPCDFIETTIVFNDNVIWNFPDLNFTYKYKYLNGFKAIVPESMFDF